MKGFVPDTGDLIWLDFDPQAGREQAGRRPALVLSPAAYNAKVGLAILCPITKHVKGYSFEVAAPSTGGLHGVILADHLKSLDWKVRRAEKLGDCPLTTLDEVRARIAPLLGF